MAANLKRLSENELITNENYSPGVEKEGDLLTIILPGRCCRETEEKTVVSDAAFAVKSVGLSNSSMDSEEEEAEEVMDWGVEAKIGIESWDGAESGEGSIIVKDSKGYLEKVKNTNVTLNY